MSCNHEGPCVCPEPCAECLAHPYIHCGQCALWLPLREDSLEPEWGTCPKRRAPHNRTKAQDGCRHGARSGL